ncbi:probable basic-leucine zipper transcription factor N isoform X2 [Ochlerotatus camptorhynchus]|uniref:probable basic-leucine zipper transcription factor N isoform X2 n=1 Tax=Ochlerotatus camptorhynchus TaxID=644619 RepID=UPI0031D2EE56
MSMGLRRRTIDSSDAAHREPVHRETWVSTNKILNSSMSLKRINSRNPNFDYDETKMLISLWGDPQVQKTLITTHKKHPVIADLAKKMREHGYNRSTEEINTRIKNLKCFYNRIKKDMAAGIINQTTWKHYAEMDEIISRPVFGNAHRMHMIQQQKQQEEQEELKKQILEQQEQMQRFPVKLEVMSDDDSTEIRAEDLLTIDTNAPEEGDTLQKEELDIKDDNDKNCDDDEDDDDDDDDSDFDVENEFNDGLDEILSKARAAAKVTESAPPDRSSPHVNNASGSATAVITTPTTTTVPISSQGKISVVPTNLLLKPPTSSVNMNSPIQIYTQPTVSLANSVCHTSMTMTSTSSAPGMAPMKLLLVNTVSKDGTTKQILTPASEIPSMPQMRPAPMLQPRPSMVPIAPKPPTVSIPAINVTQKPATITPITNATSAPKPKPNLLNGEKSPGFKKMFGQLIAIQRENLIVSRARLALEKERLEFEKQIGGPLVDVVRSLSGFFNGFLQQQLQQKHCPAAKKTQRAESELPPAKKKRTEGSVEKQQQSAVTTTETMKTEVISDNDDN